MPPLLHYSKRCVKAISQLASLFCETFIGRNYRIIFMLFLNKITRLQYFRCQFIYRYIKKTLDLTRVHIHSQHSMSAGNCNAICDQTGGNRYTRLIFFVSAAIRIVWDDGCDPGSGSTFESIYHDKQFHDGAVDWDAERLNNKYIASTHIIIDLYKNIFIAKL